jgi:hypothetical protein
MGSVSRIIGLLADLGKIQLGHAYQYVDLPYENSLDNSFTYMLFGCGGFMEQNPGRGTE